MFHDAVVGGLRSSDIGFKLDGAVALGRNHLAGAVLRVGADVVLNRKRRLVYFGGSAEYLKATSRRPFDGVAEEVLVVRADVACVTTRTERRDSEVAVNVRIVVAVFV